MKAKLVICLVLSLVLLLVLPACTEEDIPVGTEGTIASSGPADEDPNQNFGKNKYAIYISSNSVAAHSYFADDVISANELYPIVAKPEPTEQTKTIQINGISYEMEHVKTIDILKGTYCHIYESSDKKVTCQYRAKDMQLFLVKVDMDLASFTGMDQQQYEQWIQTFVSQFVQEDLSKLQLSCQTRYSGWEDGFFTEPKGEETIQGYSFKYEKYIDSVKTTDVVSASFDIEAEDGVMQVSVRFNDHEFDDFDALKVDETTVDQVIRDFMTAYMAEDITLDSYETQGEDELIIIDGNVMLRRSIFIAYKWKGLRNDHSYKLIIDIPDQ